MTVAVVGLGGMGTAIATRLLEAGHDVVVWNRSPEKVAPLVERGGLTAATPAEAAARADALITSVADQAALRAVSGGADGFAAGAHPSLLVLEMSTVGPAAIADLRTTLPEQTALIDAPVLGSRSEAADGTLTVFAGGSASDIERARPLLAQLGIVVHVGALGSGAAAKLVANATLFGTLALLGEAIAFARGLGLSDAEVYDVLKATPLAAQAERRRRVIDAGDYRPRFALRLARKDVELIRAAATAAGTELRVVDAAGAWLVDAEAAGFGELDYTALLARIVGDRGEDVRAAARNAGSTTCEYDGLIVDLDGVVWLGGHAIDGAVEAVGALRRRGLRLLFLTNDPTIPRAEQAARLTTIGIPAKPEDVMTSAAATARFLRERADLRGREAFVIGSPAFKQEVAEAGVELVSESDAGCAELVVVGGHSAFDFAELRAATRALANGAQLIAAGRDRAVPMRDGPEPATGAILAAVETASGVTATVVGKPEPFIFEIAREALECERVAVVGDNLASDIAGAKRSGLDAILVLTGASTEAELAGAAFRPDFVFATFADLASALAERDAGAQNGLTRGR